MGTNKARSTGDERGLAVGTRKDCRRAQATLFAGGRRYCTLYDQIPLMYFTLGVDGTVLMVNSYGAGHLGYRPEELVGEPVVKVVHEEDRSSVAERLGRLLEQPGSVSSWRFRKLRKDGSWIWVRETARVVEEEGNTIVLVVCEDITEQVAVEEELERYRLELRALTAEVTLAEARERRRIAEDLHDHAGQALVAARMRLGAFLEDETNEDRRASIQSVRDILRDTLRQTRSLTFELSCPVLYRLGLAAALRDLVERLGSRNGIEFEFSGEPGLAPLAEDQRVLLYRAVRELLLNVVRHARASKVRVAIGRNGDEFEVTIEDDGVGIPRSAIASGPTVKGGFGLFAVRERARHLGGRLTIEPTSDTGTRAQLAIPVGTDRTAS